MAAEQVGQASLRAEDVDRQVKNFALEEFEAMKACIIQKASGWKQTYFEETDSDLTKTVTTGVTATSFGQVPRLAEFPYSETSWTEVNTRLIKHAIRGDISWEDVVSDNIPVQARTLLRLTRGVTKSIDKAIITEIATTTQTAAASATWDNADPAIRDPIGDLLQARATMKIANWESKDGFCFMHPTDKMNLMKNHKVVNQSQFYSSIVTSEGTVERICGLKIIECNACTARTVLITAQKSAMVWYEAHALSTDTQYKAGQSYTIRVWAVGVPVLINNNAAYKLTGC